LTGTCGTADSRTATVTVGTGPAITLSPSSVAVLAPAGASFNAGASGNPAPTVQWQVSTNGGGSFSDLGGQTATTLNLASTTVAMNGYQYRAVFTNGCGTATTSAATLTVWAPVIATASTPGPTTGMTPLTVSFLGAASGGDGGPYTYSWNFGDGSPASSAQNLAHTYNIGGIYTVTLTVQDGHGNSASDNHLVINVTQSSVPVVYNVYDDQGRARACVNRYTGEYRWMYPASSPTTTVSGVATVLNNGAKFVNKPGDPNILNVTIDPLKKKASGYCIIAGVYSTIADSDTTNNPPGCY
jgi:PKD repeat protein